MVLTTEMPGLVSVEVSNFPIGQYLLVVSLDSEYNDFYEAPDSDAVTLTIYEPMKGKAKGGGFIYDADGNRGFFVFSVKYNHKGVLKGFLFFKVKIENNIYFLYTRDITGFTINDNHAFFEATCKIYQHNTETEETIRLDDTFRLRIDVWDGKKRCGDDIFQIRIADSLGRVVYEAGYDPLGEVVCGKIMVKTHGRRHH
jgi:hypothetical protein